MQTKASAIFSLVTIAVVSASYIGPNPTTTNISPYQPTTPGHIVSELHFMLYLIQKLYFIIVAV